MQISSNPQLNSSRRSQTSGTSPGFPLDPDISYTSTYTARSSESGDRKFHSRSSKSFSIAAQKVAGAFTTCFVPRIRTDEVVDRGDRIDDSFVSTASSKIYKATENFNPRNQIGEGGFGTIYKGKLQDGSLIAIDGVQERSRSAFEGAAYELGQVPGMGGARRRALNRGRVRRQRNSSRTVYYANAGTRGNGLDLGQRLNIAIDVAHAITYLHGYADDPIIHRDVKASNVLLTEALQGKVGDFGFARVVGAGEAERTHVSTQVKGTAGYVDPEYLRTYQLTPKSDVYSFGVLLVELVSGRRPIERGRGIKERVTTRWVRLTHPETLIYH